MKRRLMKVERVPSPPGHVAMWVDETPGWFARVILGRKSRVRVYQGLGMDWRAWPRFERVGWDLAEQLSRFYMGWVELKERERAKLN